MRLPYLTADLPGTGGFLRTNPEDFRVDEIPLYEPCGEGDHVYFRLWKRGLDTFEAIRRVARALDLPERAFGYAGLKDSRAVTTQWVSTDAAEPAAIEAIKAERLAILDVVRHTNKLKLGHSRGNRFQIVVCRADTSKAAPILERLRARGAPNYFGPQRFGARFNGHLCGEAMLRRDFDGFVNELIGREADQERDPYLTKARRLFNEGKLQEAYDAMPIRQRAEKKALHALIRFDDPTRAYFAIPKRMRQMYLSAYQSFLFNRVLEGRLDEIDRIEEGDLAYLHRNGAVFLVEDAEGEQARCDAFEISPSGPIFGTKTSMPEGRPGRIEREVLAETGFEPGDFAIGGGLNAKGRRRSLRMSIVDLEFEPNGDSQYTVHFSLPPGSYATSVMRELTKRG